MMHTSNSGSFPGISILGFIPVSLHCHVQIFFNLTNETIIHLAVVHLIHCCLYFIQIVGKLQTSVGHSLLFATIRKLAILDIEVKVSSTPIGGRPLRAFG